MELVGLVLCLLKHLLKYLLRDQLRRPYSYARVDTSTGRLVFWALLNTDGTREVHFERFVVHRMLRD